MASQPYKVLPVPLDVASERVTIWEPFTQVRAITVLGLPVGAVFGLHIGNQSAIPVTVEGITFESDDPCEPLTDEGVFATFPAQPGVSVTLLLSFGAVRTASASS